jgi:hypothetical protein
MKNETLQERLDILKLDYIDFIKITIQDTGSIIPAFTVFAEIKNEIDEKTGFNMLGMIHIPIPASYMENGSSKDELVEELMPKVFNKLKEDFIPHAILFSSEVWIRRVSKDQFPDKKVDEIDIVDLDESKIKKTEGIIISIDYEDKSEFISYDIIRDGKQVSSDGNLVDKVELIENNEFQDISKSSMKGRFSNLFKLLK